MWYTCRVSVTSQQEGEWWFPPEHLKGQRDKLMWGNTSSPFCWPGVRWTIFVYLLKESETLNPYPTHFLGNTGLTTAGWGAHLTRTVLPTTSWRAAGLSTHPVTHGYLPVSPLGSCQSRPGDHPPLRRASTRNSHPNDGSGEEGAWSFGEAPMTQATNMAVASWHTFLGENEIGPTT